MNWFPYGLSANFSILAIVLSEPMYYTQNTVFVNKQPEGV
jgi:hypothetical protein